MTAEIVTLIIRRLYIYIWALGVFIVLNNNTYEH